jgi:RND family efflux transporter MFP subunit
MAEEDLSGLRIDKEQIIRKPRAWKRITYAVLGAVVLLILGVLYSKGLFSGALEVEVATVTRIYPSQAFTILNASGYVVPQRKAAVASKITARLVSLAVEEGSIVRQGEVIARLESDDVSAGRTQAAANLDLVRHNLAQAKADLDDAMLAYDREKQLFAKAFTARASYDAAEARYKKAQAAVRSAEAAVEANTAALRGADVSLEYTLIRAPFNAVVLTKNADIGDIVTPLGAAANAKASVVTIADMDSLQVEADVSESNLEKVKVGQPCEIQLDALPESRFRGSVHMIVPTVDRTKATVMTKIRFIDKDKRILPEMSAKVAFLSKPITDRTEKPRTAVQNKVLRERNGKVYLFLVKGDRAIEQVVRVGEKFNDMVEIVEGVQPGDRIVFDPPARLWSNTRIKVSE